MSARLRTLFVCSMLVVMAACQPRPGNAPADPEGDRIALRRAAELFTQAYNARSGDALASTFTEDAWVMRPSAQPIAGRRAIQDDFRRAWAAQPLTVTSSESELELVGDVAWRSGPWSAKDPTGAVVMTGLYLEIWRKIDGEWKTHRSIWTQDPIAVVSVTASDTQATETPTN